MSANLIVYPADEQGWHQVRCGGVASRVAHRPSDLRLFPAEAGLENAEGVDLNRPRLRGMASAG